MLNVTAFSSYIIVTTFTPGPNNIMSMSNASRYGFKQSIRFNIGIFAGFLIVMALCDLFSVALYSIIPTIKPVMTCIGAAYILWLAWKTLKTEPHGNNDPKITNTFLSGFGLQFVNPKLILYGITIFSAFIVPNYKSTVSLAGFTLLLALVGFTATCCWAVSGAVFQRFLIRKDRTINVLMSILLVYCAITLFL